MNHILRTATLLLMSGLVAFPSGADSVRRVTPLGQDGDDLHYRVTCRDQSAGSITLRPLEQQICAAAPSKAQRCRTGWTLEQAAKYLCGNEEHTRD